MGNESDKSRQRTSPSAVRAMLSKFGFHMDRVAVTAILIVLLGIWISPFITGTNRPAAGARCGRSSG